MTASRSNVLVAALCVAMVALPAALNAQATRPINIVPQPQSAPDTEQPQPAAEEPETPVGPDAESVSAVEVATIQALDPEAVGLYEEADGGFGLEMWRGTWRTLVERLLPQMPVGTTSRAMNDLAKRLILSTAKPPEGLVGANLLSSRVERLAAMGEGAAINHLLRAAPPALGDMTIARARIDALLLTADNVGACAQARELVRRDDSLYWERVQIFCQALAGQHDAAGLGLALLRERGVDEDPALVAVLKALAGQPDAKLSSLPNPTALHLAMLREARLSVPEDAVATAGPAIARAIALTASTPLDLRLRAAERAEAMGTLPTETLAEMYAAVPFAAEDLANPLTRVNDDKGPRARALLYQAIYAQVVPAARAEVLLACWKLGRESGGWDGFSTAARVTLDALLTLTPSPDLVWIAGDATRALAAAGRPGAARAWLELAQSQASANAEAAAAVATLWPIIKLADGAMPWDGTRLAAWWKAQDGVPEPTRRWRAAVLFGLLSALGEEIPADARLALLEAPLKQWTRTLVPALWHQLDAAATAGRIGETVLLALVALDPSEHGQPGPLTLAAAVSALYRVGLKTDARALALEAVLSREF